MSEALTAQYALMARRKGGIESLIANVANFIVRNAYSFYGDVTTEIDECGESTGILLSYGEAQSPSYNGACA